jgi:hypothetical protein
MKFKHKVWIKLKNKNKMETKLKTYLCKEGKEKFTVEAKDRNEAEGICEMFNAVVIKEIKK